MDAARRVTQRLVDATAGIEQLNEMQTGFSEVRQRVASGQGGELSYSTVVTILSPAAGSEIVPGTTVHLAAVVGILAPGGEAVVHEHPRRGLDGEGLAHAGQPIIYAKYFSKPQTTM